MVACAIALPAPSSAAAATACRRKRRREYAKMRSRSFLLFKKSPRRSMFRLVRPAPGAGRRTQKSEQMADADLHAVDGTAGSRHVLRDRSGTAERERSAVIVAQMRVGAVQHGAFGQIIGTDQTELARITICATAILGPTVTGAQRTLRRDTIVRRNRVRAVIHAGHVGRCGCTEVVAAVVTQEHLAHAIVVSAAGKSRLDRLVVVGAVLPRRVERQRERAAVIFATEHVRVQAVPRRHLLAKSDIRL